MAYELPSFLHLGGRVDRLLDRGARGGPVDHRQCHRQAVLTRSRPDGLLTLKVAFIAPSAALALCCQEMRRA